jgi:hypothetical protein
LGVHPKVDFSIYFGPPQKGKSDNISFKIQKKFPHIFNNDFIFKTKHLQQNIPYFFGGGDRPSAKIHHQKEHQYP